jgi:hypothetical protein
MADGEFRNLAVEHMLHEVYGASKRSSQDAQPAVVTLTVLALEGNLYATRYLSCHRNSYLDWKVPAMAKAYT